MKVKIAALKWHLRKKNLANCDYYYEAKALFGSYIIRATDDRHFFGAFKNISDEESPVKKIKWLLYRPGYYIFKLPFIDSTKYYILDNYDDKYVYGLGKAIGTVPTLEKAKEKVQAHLEKALSRFIVRS